MSSMSVHLTGQPPHTPEQERKIQVALDLMLRVFGNFDEFDSAPFGDVYVQHNPMIADGKEGLRPFAKAMVESAPEGHGSIKRALVDGDFVLVHTHVTRSPGDPGMALMDLFRVVDDKVVEHWDVMQEVPPQSLNSNTMF